MRRVLVGGVVLCGLLGTGGGPLHAAATPAAAGLDAQHLSAASPAETLLHVTSPGRFAISVQSATGTALDLVDMITGPEPVAGTPGSLDGRLDALLDTGTYKIRLHPAAGAQGDVQLAVTPFTDAAPAALLPANNARLDATLGDLQQRSFWFSVTADHPVRRLEAAGRALADFQLWRDGRYLVATTPTTRTIEPTRGHPLRDILIDRDLPPGTYLATAYGGPAIPWPDGRADMPFHLREGAPDTLRQGWVGGQVGPFGSEVFRAGGRDDLFRLSAPGPATLTVDGNEGTIDTKSRVPAIEVRATPTKADHWVEVSAATGTPYQLRAETIATGTSLYGAGTYFVTVNTDGLGGDEVPATLILARSTAHGWSIVGAHAPEIGPGSAWHHRFNLAGQVSVLFHATAGGRIAASIAGVRLDQLDLTALDALATHPPERPETPGIWNVPAGWYALTLDPAGNTQGVADVTIGPPGLQVPLAAPSPPAPSITFGVQSLGWGEAFRAIGNLAPNSNIGLDARGAPVALNSGPLRLSQAPGEATDIPIQPDTGTLTATEYGSGTVSVAYDPATGIAHLPATDHPRLVALSWSKPVPAPVTPVPEPEAALEALRDGVPQFFDLAENDYHHFSLTIGAGGLFRVETLGRLHTRGGIGSRFVPELASDDGTGIGQNMRLAGFLRAGQYHVDVAAVESAGHAGILASPAPLLTTPSLLPGGSVRTTMPAGSGLVIPIAIAQAGQYRIDLLGLAKPFNARLEDEQGWPFAATAPFDTSTEDLQAGHYRLLVSPNATTVRAVARLTRIEAPPPLTGHGPHPLPFEAPQAFIWREPAGRTDPRAPDLWNFTLAAPADITLSITDGMEATLHAPGGEVAAHIIGGSPFTGRLKEGAYTVQASSQGRNDRLDYTLSLAAPQLQPGVPRSVDLPSSVGFALATDRVVSLTSFGATPVRAVLKDAAGQVLGRFGGRDNDWNLAVSQSLPAGNYTLDLASAAPPPQHSLAANVNDRPRDTSPQPDDAEDSDNGQEPQQSGQGGAADRAQPGDGDAPPASTELSLALPAEIPAVKLPVDAATLAGGGVHRLLLPATASGQLILAGASSVAELVLSLEQQVGGVWRNRALSHGLAPILALPPDGDAGAWRLSVWAVDGGALPIQVAARIVADPALPGAPRWVATKLAGVSAGLAVAHVALASRDLLSLSGMPGVLAAAWRGHPARVPEGGLVAPQTTDLWLVAPHAGAVALTPQAPGTSLAVTLQNGERAALPVASGKSATAWIAEAPGQPGLDTGHGMGVAEGSAFALATEPGATLWDAGDAGGAGPLRVTARPVVLAETAAQTFDGRPSWGLPGATATALHLPPGAHAWHLDLPPGTAAVAGWPAPTAVVAWAGSAAISRTIQGDWDTLLLVNTNPTPAPAGVAMGAPSAMAALEPTHAARQFFGASGSTDLAVPATNGQTLVVAGDAEATFVGADGTVRRGSRLSLTGPGRVILDHGAGLVAAWLEGHGATPWPAPKPVAVTLPASLPLSGQAMQLRLAPSQPTLLRIRSSAPLILSLNHALTIISPSGAAVSRYLPAGPATLDVIAPQDGDLSGSIELTTAPIRPATDGLGDPVTVSPGDAALFAFDLARPARIGLAVRAEPDDAVLALLTAEGHELAAGAAMLPDLPAGHYILSASVPRTAPATVLRAAILGIKPRPNGPPPDVVHFYRELAGLGAPDSAAPKGASP